MRVLYAAICEEASVRNDGRVDLHGVFHELYAPRFPARQDDVTLAVAIEWDGAESGDVRFRIDLVDPGGAPVMTISGSTEVPPFPSGVTPPRTPLVLPMRTLLFPMPGRYRWVLELAGERTVLAPLHLIENPADLAF
ncbi:MAG: DUF6941 family protein [Longimicrobiaceae bacterium]